MYSLDGDTAATFPAIHVLNTQIHVMHHHYIWEVTNKSSHSLCLINV